LGAVLPVHGGVLGLQPRVGEQGLDVRVRQHLDPAAAEVESAGRPGHAQRAGGIAPEVLGVDVEERQFGLGERARRLDGRHGVGSKFS
jgi:hypothetical protein